MPLSDQLRASLRLAAQQPAPRPRDVVVRYAPFARAGVEGRRFAAQIPLQAAAMLLADLELDPRDCWADEVMAGVPTVALVRRVAGAHKSGQVVAFVVAGLDVVELNGALMLLASGRGPLEACETGAGDERRSRAAIYQPHNPFAASGLSAPPPIGPAFL